MKHSTLRQHEVIAALKRAGFRVVRVKATHFFMQRPGSRLVCVPGDGGRELPRGTMRRVIRQSGLTNDEFQALRRD